MLRQTLCVALLLSLACGDSAAGTGNDPVPQQPAAAAKSAEPAPAAPAAAVEPGGAVTGKITFEGTPPERQPVDLKQDQVCVDLHKDNPLLPPGGILVGAGGGLRDCFIQLTDVPDKKYEAPSEPVTIDQVGCTYVPHVFGVMKKQTIKILNSDATLHNIHAMPKTNREFNFGMPNKGDVREEEFKKQEDAIHIKCDVHPWMSAYCFTMEHPYFAVSGEDGTFTLKTTDLADGEYGIKVWHEVLGEATGKVTVKDGAATFDHVFKK
jgi:hypothetical protein